MSPLFQLGFCHLKLNKMGKKNVTWHVDIYSLGFSSQDFIIIGLFYFFLFLLFIIVWVVCLLILVSFICFFFCCWWSGGCSRWVYQKGWGQLTLHSRPRTKRGRRTIGHDARSSWLRCPEVGRSYEDSFFYKAASGQAWRAWAASPWKSEGHRYGNARCTGHYTGSRLSSWPPKGWSTLNAVTIDMEKTDSEQWIKLWLFTVYRGFYYPIIWGL